MQLQAERHTYIDTTRQSGSVDVAGVACGSEVEIILIGIEYILNSCRYIEVHSVEQAESVGELDRRIEK